jgi:crotonobetainyl-CoA:carnitine CoA-transferase CaiB-like acyl-CoA transferase
MRRLPPRLRWTNARSDVGQHIDTALLDVQAAALAKQHASHPTAGACSPSPGPPPTLPSCLARTSQPALVTRFSPSAARGRFERVFQLAAHPEWPLEQRFSTKRNKSALPLR